MPDKKYNKLSDKGWVSMSTTLDREMPVKRDRKWLLIFLFFMSMGLISAGVIFWKSKKDIKVEYVNRDNVKTPNVEAANVLISEHLKDKEFPNLEEVNVVESGMKENPKGDEVQKKSLEISDSELTIENTSNTIRSEVSRPITNLILETGKRSIAVQQVRENSEVVESTINLAVSKDNAPEALKVDGMEVVAKEKSVEINPNSSVVTHPSLFPVVPLETLITWKDLRSSEKLIADPVLVSRSMRRPVSIRFYAGSAVPISGSSTGIFAGTSIEKVLNSRWRMEAGLGMLMRFKNSQQLRDGNAAFDIQDPTGLVGNSVDEDEERMVFATTDYEVRQEYYGLVSDKLSRSTYLELPISLKYIVSVRHEVGVGLRYGYLISAKNERIYLTQFASSLSTSEGYLSNSALSNAKVVNRHNASLTASYRFSLTKRWGLVANLNLGLNDIIRTAGASGNENRLNYLGLGIDYKLQM